jgi:hypothetical protein
VDPHDLGIVPTSFFVVHMHQQKVECGESQSSIVRAVVDDRVQDRLPVRYACQDAAGLERKERIALVGQRGELTDDTAQLRGCRFEHRRSSPVKTRNRS